MNGQTMLLDQAVSYAARSVLDVTPALLPRPTPCQGWNLDMLLRHASDSLAALHEGTVTGHVGLIPTAPDRDLAASPARVIWEQAHRLLAARAATDRRELLNIGDLPLPAIAIECAGAIEIAVHGWDISQACGQGRPIPDALASSLLAIAPLLIPETGRPPLFSPPVTARAQASPGNRLVAFLGRKLSASAPSQIGGPFTKGWMTTGLPWRSRHHEGSPPPEPEAGGADSAHGSAARSAIA